MHTQEIHIAGGREAVSDIRRELFAFPEILEVLATSRADSLVVVLSGRPRPAEWNRHLNQAGYRLLHPLRRSNGLNTGTLASVDGATEKLPLRRRDPEATPVQPRRRLRLHASSAVSLPLSGSVSAHPSGTR